MEPPSERKRKHTNHFGFRGTNINSELRRIIKKKNTHNGTSQISTCTTKKTQHLFRFFFSSHYTNNQMFGIFFLCR